MAKWIFIFMAVVMANLPKSKQNSWEYILRRNHSCIGAVCAQHPEKSVSDQCVPSSVDSFPADVMTQEQRMNGGILFHIIITLYACFAIAIVCDEYFVPSLDIIAEKLKISPNVAGATIMAAGTSAPEFFESLIGTFVTEGDIGVGTVVGSAYFNILGIISICGLATGKVVHLEWWPLTRDCAFYCITVAALLGIIYDDRIYWYEAIVFLILFALYIITMAYNSNLESIVTKFVTRIRCCGKKELKTENTNVDSTNIKIPTITEGLVHPALQEAVTAAVEGQEELEAAFHPCAPPKSKKDLVIWVLGWPICLLFFCTIFNVRTPRWSKMPYVIFTFIMSIAYIGALCWFIGWMVTVIGYSLGIPDTVVGLTILAAGTSVPEVFSSLTVCKRGDGSMAISNSVGSNIFDILVCLGVPWFIKSCIPSDEQYVKIISGGMVYSTIFLVAAVIFMYGSIAAHKFNLNGTVGAICLIAYAVVLALEICLELNLFKIVNPPVCPAHYS